MFFTRVLLKRFVSSKLATGKPRIEQFEGKYYRLTGDATAHNENVNVHQVIEQHILAERDHHKQYAELEELELNREALQSNKDTPEFELTNINRQIQEATIRLRKLGDRHTRSNVQKQQALAKTAEDSARKKARFYGLLCQLFMHVAGWGVTAVLAYPPKITVPTPPHFDIEFWDLMLLLEPFI